MLKVTAGKPRQHAETAAAVIPLRSPRCLKSRRGRKQNRELRSREHLTPDEVERMMAAARRRGRYGNRDALLIMLAYRHGLRASELIALRWDQIDFKAGTLHVSRLKHGSPSTIRSAGLSVAPHI